MKKTELVEPKRAAIEAQVHTQQVYLAIANKLLAVQRRGGRVYIVRRSFERWRRNLELRRRMRSAEHEERGAVTRIPTSPVSKAASTIARPVTACAAKDG